MITGPGTPLLAQTAHFDESGQWSRSTVNPTPGGINDERSTVWVTEPMVEDPRSARRCARRG